MPLVSGECRPALVLYRLYLAWLKRCPGAAAKGKTQTPQSGLRITNGATRRSMISLNDSQAAADLSQEKRSVFLARIRRDAQYGAGR